MPAQTANKATVPVGSDGWQLTAHIKTAIETVRSVIPVGSASERAALPGTFPGGVLPVPTVIARTDIAGAPLETWDGATWSGGVETYTFPSDATNGWSTFATISRSRLSTGTYRYFMEYLTSRNLTDLSIGPTLDTTMLSPIPAGWRPDTPVNMHYYGALNDNFQNLRGPLNIALGATDGTIGVSTLLGNTLTLPQYGSINFIAQWTQ